MSVKLYRPYMAHVLRDGPLLPIGPLRAVFLGADYRFSGEHAWMSDLPAPLAGPVDVVVKDDGTLDIKATFAGDRPTQYVLFYDSGDPATSPLLGHDYL